MIHPDAPPPYRDVFEAILSGIEIAGDENMVSTFSLEDDDSTTDIEEWVKNNELKTVVSLGRMGVALCNNMETSIHVVVGAILNPVDLGCESYSGVALTPAPVLLFDRLKRLKPDIDTVTVVYDDQVSSWLLKHAHLAAQKHGLKLNAYPVRNVRQAAQIYRRILSSPPDSSHAIWLPQDPYTVDQKVILPELLKASWDYDFIVFSSNPSHVQRGVLFALYPDYERMGQRLGAIAANRVDLSKVKKNHIEPLRDVLIAVNLRTANHLGLNLSNSQISEFDLTFPASR